MTTTIDTTQTSEARQRHGVLAWLWRVVVYLFLLTTISVLAAAVLVPRVAGATPYTILTGSMKPTMPPGTLVVVKPVEFDAIRVGDVVTYQLRSGEPAVVTHRVVAAGATISGEASLQTQGDANPQPDRHRVREEQVRGVVWYSVPHLGRVSNFLTVEQRDVAVTGAAVILGGYALVMFVAGFRERRTRS